jgi:hypothetical protein
MMTSGPALLSDPIASQWEASPPISRFLAKALWQGKSRKIDLRYTCELGVDEPSLVSALASSSSASRAALSSLPLS